MKNFELFHDKSFQKPCNLYIVIIMLIMNFVVLRNIKETLNIGNSCILTLYKLWSNYNHPVTHPNWKHSYSLAHASAQISFQKPLFWIQKTSKHINPIKTRYRNYWPKILSLPSGSLVMKAIIESPFFKNIIQINSEIEHQLNTCLLFILVEIHAST